MSARYATPEEVAHWNEHILANPDGGNVFASYEFARQKETGGYKAHFVIVDNLAVTVLEKSTPPLGKFWYVPKGPEVTTSKALLATLKELEPLAQKRGVFAIRIETELTRENCGALTRKGLQKARPVIPNPSTITLDISRSLDDILTGLPQKGRHGIRRAERDGVTIERVPASEKNVKTMYTLLAGTAEGQFGIRSFAYYKSFWQRFERAGYGQLFFAKFEGKVVAGAYAMAYGTKSTYKDGASIRKRTAYGASHLLQWEVIQWAKESGALVHDFCGAPPSEDINNPEHPHYGIGLFKTSFNKTVTDYIGCYDYVISNKKYAIWARIGERIAWRLHRAQHGDAYL